MLVIALQDSVIAKDFKPFWGCLLQSGRLLCWERPRAISRASPGNMWQTRTVPLGYNRDVGPAKWPKHQHQLVKQSLLCLFWAALRREWPWAEGGERWGEGGKDRKFSRCFLCSHTLPWVFAVARARYGRDPVSPFLFSCSSSLFCSKNNEIWGV